MAQVHASPGALVYARALAEVAEAKGGIDALREVGERLGALANAWREDGTLRAYFLSASISSEKKQETLGRLVADLTPRMLPNFIKLLAQRGRLGLIEEISDGFRELLDAKLGRVPVTITTAVPVNETDFRGWVEKIRASIGGEPVVQHIVKPEIVAGAIIRVGDRVMDGSASRRLDELRESIIQRGKQTNALQS